jgi:hypothetical protein
MACVTGNGSPWGRRIRVALLLAALVLGVRGLLGLRRLPPETAWLLPVLLGAVLLQIALLVRERSRPDAGPALRPLRLLFCAAVLGTAVVVAVGPPLTELRGRIPLALLGGVLALALAADDKLSRRRPRWAGFLDLALFQICLVIVGLEVGMRLVARTFPSPLFARTAASSLEVISQNRIPPDQTLYGLPMDSRGYHDRELDPEADRPLVVCIGDSFSVGVVPHYFHYTTVAERQLPGTEIYNVGVAAIGPPEYLYLLERDALPLHPDLLVVSLFMGNDIAENERFGPGDKPLWFDRNHYLIYLVPQRLLRLARTDYGAFAEGFASEGRAAPWIDDPEALRSRYPFLADPGLELPRLDEGTFFEYEVARLWQVMRPGEMGQYEKLFPVLDAILDAAGATPVVFLLIPAEAQVEDGLWEQVRARVPPDLELDRDQPQRIVGLWLRERDVPFLDPLSAFRAVEPLSDGDRHLYHVRDTHLNVRGNDVLGRELAAFLAPLLEAER